MSRERRSRKVTVRLTPTEYEGLGKKIQSTVSRELSYYIRNVLLNKPVVIKVHNASLDALMEELIQLKQELNAIGNNFNQAVKKLHILKQISEFREWIQTNESLHQQFFQKVIHIEQRIEKMSEQWLQG
jgi:citrate lyase gamma subunit